MPLGSFAIPQPRQIAQGDTAELTDFLTVNEQPVTDDQILSVNVIVQKPDGNKVTQSGTVLPDGAGFLRWTDTSEEGPYNVQMQFNLITGEVRSTFSVFSVIDPFNPPIPTDTEIIVESVWIRLEDCFDSMEGGPWLRDQSLAHFDATKIADFIPEALLEINVQMPPTNYDVSTFATSSVTPGDNPNMPLLVKGVLCLTIRHLMRSYTEQPTPANMQAPWHDRTRYQQLWGQIYQIEYADFISIVRLWKRTGLMLGHSAVLISNKAGRLAPYGVRTRGISRGYF